MNFQYLLLGKKPTRDIKHSINSEMPHELSPHKTQ